jgi:hypothetical protein
MSVRQCSRARAFSSSSGSCRERAADDAAAIMLDLHMMTITGGRARNLAEFDALLVKAGLKQSKVTPTRSGLTIIEAVPA